MASETLRPDYRTALPRVFFVRWWLFRIAMAVVVAFFFSAAILAPRTCEDIVGGHGGNHQITRETDWRIPLRLEVAAAGIGLGLVITFIGARLDHWVSRRRARRLA